MYTYVCVIFIYEYNARARAHTSRASVDRRDSINETFYVYVVSQESKEN